MGENKLKIIIHKGINLSNKDLIGKSDPYVLVQYGAKKLKSKPVKANLNPVWDYAVELDLNDKPSDNVVISVYDDDFGKDDLMGTVDLSVKEIKEIKAAGNKTLPLKKCKTGEIVFSYGLNQEIPIVKAEPDAETKKDDIVVEVKEQDDSIKTPAKKEEIIMATPDVKEKKPETATDFEVDEKAEPKPFKENNLKIIIHKGINLSNKGLIGKSDPYVLVQYGAKKLKSKPVKANLNPVWDYAVELDLNDKPSDNVVISVYDDDFGKDDLMGTVDLSVKEIKEIKAAGNRTLPLKKCKTGEIVFSYGLNQEIPIVKAEPVAETKKDDIVVEVKEQDDSIKTPAKKEEIIIATPDVKEKKPETATDFKVDEKAEPKPFEE